MGAEPAQPLSPAQVFERGWKLWWSNFGQLAIGTLVVYVPMQILNMLVIFVTQPSVIDQFEAYPALMEWSKEVATNPSAQPPPEVMALSTFDQASYSLVILGQVLSIGIAVFGMALFLAMAVEMTTAAAAGIRLGWREALDRSVDRVWRMALLVFLWGLFLSLVFAAGAFIAAIPVAVVVVVAQSLSATILLVTLAMLTALVPVTWLGTMWAVPVPVLIYEGKGNFVALGRSFALVKNRFWATCGAFALMVLVQIILMLIFVTPGIVALFVGAPVWLSLALMIVGGILLTVTAYPMLGGVISSIYLDLRLRKEGLTADAVASPPVAPEPSAAIPPPTPEQGA
jgi:hypothetical protein